MRKRLDAGKVCDSPIEDWQEMQLILLWHAKTRLQRGAGSDQ